MKEKILITVKAYPALSGKYAETVCTAGVNEAGEWRRLYPVPFRQLHQEEKYKKFQWIETNVSKSTSDDRPETYRIKGEIRLLGEPLSTINAWQERRFHFINKVETHENFHQLISLAHDNQLSLALYKPYEWINFKHEDDEQEWNWKKLTQLEQDRKQSDLFRTDMEVTEAFRVVPKLPYKFSYVFRDEQKRKRTLMIEDWEIGALYWKCVENCRGDRKAALQDVRQKYWNEFIKSENYDLRLILGTTFQFHRIAPNPFVIIGVVPLPRDDRRPLFDTTL